MVSWHHPRLALEPKLQGVSWSGLGEDVALMQVSVLEIKSLLCHGQSRHYLSKEALDLLFGLKLKRKITSED